MAPKDALEMVSAATFILQTPGGYSADRHHGLAVMESGGRSVVLGPMRFFRISIMLRGGRFCGCRAPPWLLKYKFYVILNRR